MGLKDVFNSMSLSCMSDSEQYYGFYKSNYITSALDLNYAGHT